MQLKSILNRVARNKSFVYGSPRFIDDALRPRIEVPIRSWANGRPVCSSCGHRRPGYDRLTPRRFEFVPLWQIAVVFVYTLRRVDCPRCGVVVEQVPWATGKSRLTIAYQWFLAGWARRLSWQEVAAVFHTRGPSLPTAPNLNRSHAHLLGSADEMSMATKNARGKQTAHG